MHALRVAYTDVVSNEDAELRRRWTTVVAATPSVLNGVLGGILLKTQRAIAEFLGDRLAMPSDGLVPMMLAAAAQGVVQAAQIHGWVNGGDLAAMVSEGLELLERGIGSEPQTWSQPPASKP